MSKAASKMKAHSASAHFAAAKLDGLYPLLDGIAWMDLPSANALAQFSGADPRTVGKVLKNAELLGLVAKDGSGYLLLVPYPYDGKAEQKRTAIRDVLLRYPILESFRQFCKLGDQEADALRKAATLHGLMPFDPKSLAPLIDWARQLDATHNVELIEDAIDEAVAEKERRHVEEKDAVVAFISHSSLDKRFVRQLASDLKSNGVEVWLDEQRIHVGDSIPEKISQGLAESDFFLLAVSENSVASEWVKKELNSALVTEVEKKAVHVLPLKLDEASMPNAVQDKKYANFSDSYRDGLDQLLQAMGRTRK